MRHIGTPLRLSLLVAGGLLLVAVAVLVATRPSIPTRAAGPVAAPVAAVQPAVTHSPVAAALVRHVVRRHAAAASVAGGVALRAYRDPETGTWGPAPAGMQSPAAALAPTDESYVVTLPSGAEMLVNSSPDYVVATLGANGKCVIRSVSDPRQTRLDPVPAPKPVER